MFRADIKEEIGRLRVEEGRTVKSLSEEYGVSVGSVSRWSREYRESPKPRMRQQNIDALQRECEELRRENESLRSDLEKARIEADVLREVIRSFAAGQSEVYPVAM